MSRSPSSRLLVAVALGACGGPQGGGARSCPQDTVVTLGGQEDVVALAGCKSVSGLAIRTGATLDLAPLHALESIRGDLVIGPTVRFESAGFPELRSIGGTLQVTGNGDLHGILFPRLEHVARVEIDSNVALRTVAMPQLTTVDGSLVVTGCGSLEILDVAALATVGKELVIADNPQLVIVEAASVKSAGAVRVSNNQSLPPEVATALGAVGQTAPP